MNKFKRIIILVILSFFLIHLDVSFGYSNNIKIIYDNFYTNLEIKINDDNKILSIIEKLDKKLDLILKNKKLSLNSFKLILELKKENLKKIRFLKNKIHTKKEIKFISKQQIKASNLNGNKNNLSSKTLLKNKKYKLSELKDYFHNYFDEQNPFFLEDGNYYTFEYNYFSFFEGVNYLTISDLEYNKIDPKTTLLIKQSSGRYVFSNNFEKIKLASKEVLNDITNLNEVLINLKNDYYFKKMDFEKELVSIKLKTEEIINGMYTDDQKIRAIYDYIVNNIDYDLSYNSGNSETYSGIITFKNKRGVCDGYVKLFLYMLSFANIKDVEIKRGYALDFVDFPRFGHAWVRIGNYYYDPTFDDPIGNNEKRNGNNFLYYKLPYKLIYTDRFDGYEIPEYLKNTTLEERKKIVLKNRYDIFEEFKDYNLLHYVKNRINFGFDYDEKITLKTFLEKLPVYVVKKDNIGTYFIDDLNNKKYIKSIKYYVINDDNIDLVIKSLQNTTNLIVLVFDGEYRLVYNLTLH